VIGGMKKAVIVTECRRYYFNFGETLQAVALNRIISNFGFKCVTASYEDTKKGLINYLQTRTTPYKLRGIKFELFRQKHMKYQMFRSNKKEAFEKYLKSADVIFCGSDCIWYEHVGNDILFLYFPNVKVPKIAYAPSLRDSIVKDKNYLENVKKWTKEIDYLSTREIAGSKIISDVTGRQVETVLDPTLLCSKNTWKTMSAPRIEKEPYIVCYFIGKTAPLKKIINQIKKTFSGKKMVWIGMENNNGYFGRNIYLDIGPAEFISLIQHADIVITDSFHGTAFSLIFEKQFYAIQRIVDYKDQYENDARICNILELLGIFNYYQKDDIIDFSESHIDYRVVTPFLKKLRVKSMNYIKRALLEQKLEVKNCGRIKENIG